MTTRYDTTCNCKEANGEAFEMLIGDYVVVMAQVAEQMMNNMVICGEQRRYAIVSAIATLTRKMAVSQTTNIADEQEWEKVLETLVADVRDRVQMWKDLEAATILKQGAGLQ